MKPGCGHLDITRVHPSRCPLRGLLRMRSVGVSGWGLWMFQDEVQWCGGDLSGNPTKRKRPWGAGVFVVNLGVVGVLIIHVATLGGCKEPREFREFTFSVRLLAYD